MALMSPQVSSFSKTPTFLIDHRESVSFIVLLSSQDKAGLFFPDPSALRSILQSDGTRLGEHVGVTPRAPTCPTGRGTSIYSVSPFLCSMSIHTLIMIFYFWMVHLGRISCEIEELIFNSDLVHFRLKEYLPKRLKKKLQQRPKALQVFKADFSAAIIPVFMILQTSD